MFGWFNDMLDGKFIKEYGINVIDASIIDVHPDDQLKEAINNRVTALQKKQFICTYKLRLIKFIRHLEAYCY